MDAAGQIYLKDQAVALADLTRQFTLSAQANPQTEVLLRADQSVPYGRIVEVMGAAQKAGLNRIGFVADAPVAKP
jgi:biopolymer transport protein TolR